MQRVWPAILALTAAVIGGYLALVPLQQSLSGDGSLTNAPEAIAAPHVSSVPVALVTRGGPAATVFASAPTKATTHVASHPTTPSQVAPATTTTQVSLVHTTAAASQPKQSTAPAVNRSRGMVGGSTASQGSSLAGAHGSTSRQITGGSSANPG
jgi:hypothetical protein